MSASQDLAFNSPYSQKNKICLSNIIFSEPSKGLVQEERKEILRRSSLCQQMINITNQLSKHRLNFGSQFKEFLEPRDQVLEHSFNFSFPASKSVVGELENGELPEDIREQMKQFLVQSASNVTSAAFKFLCNGELTESQAKEYASKNMLLNLNSILRETVKGIKSVDGIGMKLKNQSQVRQILGEKGLTGVEIQHVLQKNWVELEKYKQQLERQNISFSQLKSQLMAINSKKIDFVQRLAVDTDNLMNEILVNLADNYPQAPPTGGTLRMRDAILDINRVQDEENDLILANGITTDIISIMKKDHNRFIMEVINTAIRVTQISSEDKRERTVKDIFDEFNEKLFCLSQENEYHSLIKMNDEVQKMKVNIDDEKRKLVQFFNQTLSQEIPKNEKISNLSELEMNKQELFRSERESFVKQICNSAQSVFQKFQSQRSKFFSLDMKKKLQQFRAKGDKKYTFGSKIPAFVQEFNRHEMESQTFTAKHSSILRILTKWSDYLEQIFQNPEITVLRRAYPFKTVENHLILLENNSKGSQLLINNLKQEYNQVKRQFSVIAKNFYRLMGQLLSQSSKFSSCVGRYAETRTVASKINAVLIHHMLIYTNILICHLLKAGEGIATNEGIKDINLVVFRVSDLLRAKFQCNQSGFISLLKTIYLLDSDSEMKGKFKLVRIKNKLDESANNIMINYMFLGKVQCQLQLSIQEPKGKAKNYYAFSHFVYELTRGKFGAIAQCAIMISQLDPMIASCKQNYYAEKKGRKIVRMEKVVEIKQGKQQQLKEEGEKNKKEMKDQQEKEDQKKLKEKLKNSVFQCASLKCNKLIINQVVDVFKQKNNQKVCNSCVIAHEKHPEREIEDWNLSYRFLINGLKRMVNFGELKDLKQTRCIYILNNRGKIDVNYSIFVNEEVKTFLVKQSEQLQRLLIGPQFFDSSTLDYIDITKQIKEQSYNKNKKEQLMFMIQEDSDLAKEVGAKMKKIQLEFKKFRQEKALIKNIKFKIGVINANYDLAKWETLGTVVEKLGSPAEYDKKKSIRLRYQKYKHLDLSTIIQIYGKNMKKIEHNSESSLTELPVWIGWLKNLKYISLEQNRLKQINERWLPSSLVYLNLQENQLTSIDLSGLSYLVSLNLSKNKLQTIDLSSQFNLKYIQFQHNQLKFINFGNICNLIRANFSYNKLISIKLSNLPSLMYLYLSSNQLNKVDLNGLNNLTQVDLSRNNLKNYQLSSLPKLQSLNLSENKLSQLRISDLTKLSCLYLKNNELEFLNLEGARNLIKLDIRSNSQRIKIHLPFSIQRLDADRGAIAGFDFKEMIELRQLNVCKGYIHPKEIMHLSSKVKLFRDGKLMESLQDSQFNSQRELQKMNNLNLEDSFEIQGNQKRNMSVINPVQSKLQEKYGLPSGYFNSQIKGEKSFYSEFFESIGTNGIIGTSFIGEKE